MIIQWTTFTHQPSNVAPQLMGSNVIYWDSYGSGAPPPAGPQYVQYISPFQALAKPFGFR